MTSLTSRFTTAAIAVAALCGSVTVASQASAQPSTQVWVACNDVSHECWHTHNQYAYPPSSHVQWHTVHWVQAQGWPVSWRHDRFERGYYRSGVWIAF